MTTHNADQSKKVVVLGAGVIGLTTALKIQEQGGYQVTIIAEVLPSDAKTIKYTSHWAGAHHVFNIRKDERQYKLERDTFHVLWELSRPGSDVEGCLLRAPQTEYYDADGVRPPLESMPDYKELPKDELPPNVAQGFTFSTITIDTPRYLNYLMARFIGSGGTVIKGAVQHINQVLEGGPHVFSPPFKHVVAPDALIICTGIGSRFLGGVEDRDVYPIRGQTVLVRAPWIRFGKTTMSKTGELTYMIPRKNGDVILGGTKIKDDWYPVARPETTRDILERTFSACPDLAPPAIRAQREPTVEDIVVLEEGCGLRPGRIGGIRLETQWSEAGKGRKVPVVFNYGHAGYGYQTSWASADFVLALLTDALASIPN